jgi:hypothetical protein
MGKTNTASVSVPAFEMKGKTANEIKAALDGGIVTKAAVVTFLKEREAAGNLRAPSKKLLADLTGTKVEAKVEAKPVAPAPVKVEVKATPVVATPAPDVSGILARLAALEAEVASLKAALAADDEDEDEVDADEGDDDTDADEDDGDEDDDNTPLSLDEAKAAMGEMSLSALREACKRAGFEAPKGGKAVVVDALVQHGIEGGMIAAPVAAPVVEVKVVTPAPVKAVKPVKATPASVAAAIDLGSDLF